MIGPGDGSAQGKSPDADRRPLRGGSAGRRLVLGEPRIDGIRALLRGEDEREETLGWTMVEPRDHVGERDARSC